MDSTAKAPASLIARKVRQMEAKVFALAFLSARLQVFVTDAPSRPEIDESATPEQVRNWRRAQSLLALIEAVSARRPSAPLIKKALGSALDRGALEPHSAAHSAVADFGATL